MHACASAMHAIFPSFDVSSSRRHTPTLPFSYSHFVWCKADLSSCQQMLMCQELFAKETFAKPDSCYVCLEYRIMSFRTDVPVPPSDAPNKSAVQAKTSSNAQCRLEPHFSKKLSLDALGVPVPSLNRYHLGRMTSIN